MAGADQNTATDRAAADGDHPDHDTATIRAQATGRSRRERYGHPLAGRAKAVPASPVTRVAVSHDGNTLVAGQQDGHVRIWALTGGRVMG